LVNFFAYAKVEYAVDYQLWCCGVWVGLVFVSKGANFLLCCGLGIFKY